MHRIVVLAAMAALVIAGVATADAAPRKKKPHAATDRSAVTAVKHKRHYVAKPQAVPLNQQWPTSWSDGSFSYGGRFRD